MTKLQLSGPLVRNAFTPPVRVQLECLDPHITQQEFTDECDVNNVILRFSGTGELPPRLNARVAEYLDVSDIGDLHESLSRVRAAQDFFDSLPDQVREAVGNDPLRLLDALDEHARLRASTEADVTTPAPPAPAAVPPSA